MSRYSNPQPQYFDDAGEPLAGGKLYFYESGTSTLKDTFSDASLAVANTNPVLLDGDGRISLNVFLDGSYKVRLTTASDVLVWEKDPVGSADAGIASFSDWVSSATYNLNNITEYDAKFYLSLSNGNIANQPDTSTSDWAQIRYIKVDEADFTDGTFLTLDQIRPYASNAEAIAGLLDNKSVTPAALSATFTDFETNTLATVATTGAYADLSGTPTLATVATTGDYTDLINKPDIPSVDLTIVSNTSNLVLTDTYQNQVILTKATGVSYSLSLGSFSIGTAVVLINTTSATNISLSIASATTQRLNDVVDGSCFLLPGGSAIVFRESATNFWVQGDITDVV